MSVLPCWRAERVRGSPGDLGARELWVGRAIAAPARNGGEGAKGRSGKPAERFDYISPIWIGVRWGAVDGSG